MSLSKPYNQLSYLEKCIKACFFSEICEYLNFRELYKLTRVSKTAWDKLSKNAYILHYVNPEKWLKIEKFNDFKIVVQFQQLKKLMPEDYNNTPVKIDKRTFVNAMKAGPMELSKLV